MNVLVTAASQQGATYEIAEAIARVLLLAGRLAANGLNAPQRLSLLLFRGLQGDWRDWDEIERFATAIADSLATRTTRKTARPRVEETL